MIRARVIRLLTVVAGVVVMCGAQPVATATAATAEWTCSDAAGAGSGTIYSTPMSGISYPAPLFVSIGLEGKPKYLGYSTFEVWWSDGTKQALPIGRCNNGGTDNRTTMLPFSATHTFSTPGSHWGCLAWGGANTAGGPAAPMACVNYYPFWVSSPPADSDGDGTPDVYDPCSTAKGTTWNQGCAPASYGTACIFEAPTGATVAQSPWGPVAVGHSGWAFRSGTGDTWTYGSTENMSGKPQVAAGGDTSTWIRSGKPWATVVKDFRSSLVIDSKQFHAAGWYKQFRCQHVPLANTRPQAAAGQAQVAAASGYDVLTNNCLTKSVDILRVYGATITPQPAAAPPNSYFALLNEFNAIQSF